MHGLQTGIVEVGREADLLVMDAPLGSQAEDALGALAIGDTPAVVSAIIDGMPRFTKSRNTPAAGAAGVVLELAQGRPMREGTDGHRSSDRWDVRTG